MKTTGYIIDGIYYSDQLPADIQPDSNSSTYKAYEHDRQRQNHRRDLIQPYINGAPNPEFIEQYPEEAQNYYG